MSANEKIRQALEYHQAGNLLQAEHLYKKIIKKQSKNAAALHMLGVLYSQMENYDSAIVYIKKALQIAPTDAYIHYNLGNVYRKKGDLDKAFSAYQKAVQVNPKFADGHYNMGTIFEHKGQLNEAVQCFQRALQIDPNLSDAYCSLGDIYQKKGNLDEAKLYYQKALQLDHTHTDAYIGLGNYFFQKEEFDEAARYYQKALKLDPYNIEVIYNMGNALKVQDKLDEAIAAYDKALSLKPDYFMASWARCIAQIPVIYQDQSDILPARERYNNELLNLRDTIKLDTPQNIDEAAKAIGTHQPFCLAYQGMNDRELQQIYGDLVCKIMTARYPAFSDRPPMPAFSSAIPLRVGLVSAYFRLHSNWKIPIKGWIENLDRKRFKLYGYHTDKVKDFVTEAAKESFDRFVDNVYSFEDLCRTIREDNLHIIIYPEIGMDPTTVRLASLRLAPVQCASWGHADTTGLPTIDYYLGSDLMEPPDADEHYTEKLVRLPNLSVYYTPIDIQPTGTNRESLGLRKESAVYLCSHTLPTHLPQYDEVYPRIAQQVGDCRFLFVSYYKQKAVTEQFRSRLSKTFSRSGLNPEEYLVFLSYLTPQQYLAVNYLSDVFLDTMEWSGCNSSFEAINCNLPIVTLPGKLMRGRHSMAILTMMGVTDTIAKSLDHYIELAVKLGRDPESRRLISEKISANKHLIYRDKTCIAALEDFLERAARESA